MAVISHKGVDYSGKSVKVQSDASATSLNALDVPNGQTVTSFVNSELTNSYTTTGLATAYGTIVDGGYAKIGNLVIVNVRINLTEQVPAGGVLCSGFPISKSTYNINTVKNNKNVDMSLGTGGSLSATSVISTGTVLASTVYLCV